MLLVVGTSLFEEGLALESFRGILALMISHCIGLGIPILLWDVWRTKGAFRKLDGNHLVGTAHL